MDVVYKLVYLVNSFGILWLNVGLVDRIFWKFVVFFVFCRKERVGCNNCVSCGCGFYWGCVVVVGNWKGNVFFNLCCNSFCGDYWFFF